MQIVMVKKGLELLHTHGLQDAVVDEVGLRPLNAHQNLMHLLRGAEPVVLNTLARPAGPRPGTAAPTLFCSGFLHNSEIVGKFANENPSGGGFPPRGSELFSDNLSEVDDES